MGLRLAKRVLIDCDFMPSKRPERFKRDVKASSGIWSLAMLMSEQEQREDLEEVVSLDVQSRGEVAMRVKWEVGLSLIGRD